MDDISEVFAPAAEAATTAEARAATVAAKAATGCLGIWPPPQGAPVPSSTPRLSSQPPDGVGGALHEGLPRP
jgi:hypothetical protein